MIPYVILIILAFFCASTDIRRVKNRFIIVIPFLLLMFMMAAFRDELGGDYPMYKAFYSHIVPIKNYLAGEYEPYYRTKSFEVGFTVFASLVRTIDFTDGPFFFMFCIALLSITIFILSLKEYTPFVFIALLFYLYKGYFWHDFTLSRQAIAIAIFTYSIRYVKSKSYLKYLVLNIIACSFHSSALILLPLCFFLNYRFESRTILIVLGVAFLIAIFSTNIMDFAMRVATIFGLSVKMGFYIDDKQSVNPINFIEILIFVFICLFYRKEYESKEPYFNIIFNIFLFSSVLLITFSSYSIFARFKEYFVVSYIILISYIIGHIRSDNIRLGAFLLLSLYVTFGYFRYIIYFGNGVLIPYKWILW